MQLKMLHQKRRETIQGEFLILSLDPTFVLVMALTLLFATESKGVFLFINSVYVI